MKQNHFNLSLTKEKEITLSERRDKLKTDHVKNETFTTEPNTTEPLLPQPLSSV